MSKKIIEKNVTVSNSTESSLSFSWEYAYFLSSQLFKTTIRSIKDVANTEAKPKTNPKG